MKFFEGALGGGGTLKVISAGIGCVWNIAKGYEKNMAYFWSGGGGGGYCIDTYNLCCPWGRGGGVAITWNGP